MQIFRGFLIVGFALLMTFPAFAKESRSGVGVGYNVGTLDFDGLPDELDFVGFNVWYKWGINDMWGVLVSYRDMEDDEDLLPGFEIEYTQIGVHAVIMWRHGMKVRPHVKFGLALTDVEVIGVSEDDTTLSIGGGLEVGSESFAFYADYDYTEPDLSGTDFEIGNLTLGAVFKF